MPFIFDPHSSSSDNMPRQSVEAEDDVQRPQMRSMGRRRPDARRPVREEDGNAHEESSRDDGEDPEETPTPVKESPPAETMDTVNIQERLPGCNVAAKAAAVDLRVEIHDTHRHVGIKPKKKRKSKNKKPRGKGVDPRETIGPDGQVGPHQQPGPPSTLVELLTKAGIGKYGSAYSSDSDDFDTTSDFGGSDFEN